MRYIQMGEKTVAVYSEHYREKKQSKNQKRFFKRSKNNKTNTFRKPCINSKSKQNIPTNEVKNNAPNKNIPPVNHEQPSPNPSRTPLEVFVEAIRNMQRILAEDINFTSR